MAEADEECDKQDLNIAKAELAKQNKIIGACFDLSTEQLCGGSGTGLNMDILSAGCLALDPGYECSLAGFLNCVGGPLQRQLTGQISSLLDPRASESLAALGLQGQFPGVPVTRKRNEDLPAANRMDVWSFTPQAGDEVVVRVNTRDDGGNLSTLAPLVTLVGGALTTPVVDTSLGTRDCPVPSACGAQCPTFRRTVPFTGTCGLMVRSGSVPGCAGGKYRLVVTSTGGGTPTLVADDVIAP
ncbi:MAG: hypothetical protein FJ148_03260 [Deltaproteobacteria bacterium]|nr:hypothetical protein [Deltaproteobacteria bacterium]